MKSFTGFAFFAAIALCALLSTAQVSASDDDDDEGTIDVDIDIEVTADLVKATTIIFNTLITLLLPVLLQIAPLLIGFLEELLY